MNVDILTGELYICMLYSDRHENLNSFICYINRIKAIDKKNSLQPSDIQALCNIGINIVYVLLFLLELSAL